MTHVSLFCHCVNILLAASFSLRLLDERLDCRQQVRIQLLYKIMPKVEDVPCNSLLPLYFQGLDSCKISEYLKITHTYL